LHSDTTRLARDIERDSMLRSTTTLPAPAAAPDGNDVQFRLHSPLVDRCPDLARLPLADADKSVTITDGDNCSEPGPLPSVCLFLDKPYPENLLLNIRQERVHDLWLFDPQSLGEDLFHGYDLSLLDLSAELGFRNPSDQIGRASCRERVLRAESVGVVKV